ncbi:MAG: glycosyltransferase [Synechococcaceae cyanobacterium]|nr:glycosyltransferase [Synechococcaceae cyanobacterium]
MDDLWVVLPHLGPGGAQKVGLLAAGHFAAQGLKVRVLTLYHDHPVLHHLPPGITHSDIGPDPTLIDISDRSLQARGRRFCRAQLIKLRRWGISPLLWLLWPWIEQRAWPGRSSISQRVLKAGMLWTHDYRLRQLKELFARERPQRVLALLSRTNIVCCYAAWDLPIHVVVSERNDPRRQKLRGLYPRLRRVYYRRADVVTANTVGVLEALREIGPWRRLELLPNPLPANRDDPARAASDGPRLNEVLAVARLVHQKGLDLLIRALAELRLQPANDWRLVLVGDGPERQSLEELALREGLADRVRFEGFQSNPGSYLARASVFVLPSRHEGMPNALLEAMAAALPVVVSDASPGPLEIVEPEVTGLVVPRGDVGALAAALGRLIANPELRERLGRGAAARLASLSWEVVEPHWRSVLALPPAPGP